MTRYGVVIHEGKAGSLTVGTRRRRLSTPRRARRRLLSFEVDGSADGEATETFRAAVYDYDHHVVGPQLSPVNL